MIRVSNDWWMNITVFFLWRPSCYSTSRSDLSSSKSTASLTSKTTWYGTVESSRDTAWRPCRWWCWIRMIPRAIKKMISAGMDGFFYERAFEAVEQLMDAATVWCCRDSAIFSYRDQRKGQEIGSMTESTTVTIKPPPPPTAAKTQLTQ